MEVPDVYCTYISETCSTGESDKLSASEVMQMTQIPELEKLTRGKSGTGQKCFQFWCEEKNLEQIELPHGNHIRLKTKGSGPYIGKRGAFHIQSMIAKSMVK